MRKILSVIGLFFVIVFSVPINLHSYYFYDDFSSQSGNWIWKLKYSRSQGIWNATENETVDNNGGRLRFTGTGYTASYSTYFYGFGVLLTNKKFNASKENPFGFEIKRISARLDYHDDTTNPESGRMRAELLFYLAQFKNSVTNGNIGARFDDFITFVEFSRAQLDSEPDVQPYSFFTYNESGSREDSFDLTSLARPNGGGTFNFKSLLEWTYDDYWKKNTYNTGGIANDNPSNTNVVKFRVTTDGERAYFYVNPAPDSATSLSNEFYLIGSIPITFSSNIVPMIAVANNRPDNELIEAIFDDFTIRTIASNVVAEISPQVVRAGGSVVINGVIRPTFSTTDEAGIQEIYIKLPEGYSWTTAMTNGFVIRYINTNDGSVFQSFSKVNGDINPSSGNVAISIKEGGRTLKVRFNATSDSSYDIFHPNKFGGVSQANQKAIQFIISNFVTSGVADNIGKDFEIYVNNEKYADTAWSRVATTGQMKAAAGDAINMALLGLSDGNTLTFRTCYDPVGLAGLRAGNVLQGNKIYEGDSGVFFHYDFSTANATINNAAVTKIEISIPDGFTVDPTSLYSDKIGSTTNIYLTNSARKIVIDYGREGTQLPPVSGGDTLHFSILSTTNFENTNELRISWPVVCFSSVAGTASSNMLTNELYPLQSVLVRKKPPIGEAYVDVKYLRNTYYSNTIGVVVKNMGASGNRIYYLRIAFDPHITNVREIQSVLPSTNAVYTENGTNFIFIDYGAAGTNLANGKNDTITFKAFADIIPLTNENIKVRFAVEADNRNGDGWVAIPEGSDGLSVTYYTPFAEVKGKIYFPGNEGGSVPPPYYHVFYTDVDFGTNVIVNIRNDGEERNVISQVKIELPPDITNVANIQSQIKGGDVTNYKQGNTNIIEVYYTNVTFNPGEEDSISFLVYDKVEDPANLTLKLYARNTTNYKEGGEWVPDNLTLNYIYPPALGKAYVEVPGGFIDTATNRYTIQVVITNEGRAGNIIKSARLSFDTAVFTNVMFIGSSLGGASGGYAGGLLEVIYPGDVFRGGEKDVITLEVFDKVDAGSKVTALGVDISNQRWWTNVVAPAGKTLNIELIPPPTMYSYKVSPNVMYNTMHNNVTNTNTIVISISNRGWGSNNLDKVKVNIPSFLVGKVVGVSNEMLGITNSQPGLKISNNNAVWLEYDVASTNLVSGGLDRLFVYVNVDFTNVTNTLWLVEAANNSTNEDGSHNMTNNGWMLGGGTNNLYFVEMPLVYTTNTNIISATVSNYLTFFVRNGSEVGNGVSLKKVRIGLPYPFSGISNVSSGGVASVYQDDGTNFVEIDYGATGLIPGSDDAIKFWAYDVWLSGEIEKKVSVEVDYGNGSGYRVAGEDSASGSLTIKFINPVAVAVGYTTPNSVSHDFDYLSYSLFVKNNGVSGNDILRLIVKSPSFITNVNDAVSVKGGICEISNNNILVVYYTNIGGLLSGDTDVISFTGYDNVDYPAETFGSWLVYADNTLDGNGISQAGVYGTGSYNLEVKNPGYQAMVYIEASNSVSVYDKNKIYTTVETNVLYFYVNNTGISGNNIQKLKIQIPDIDTILSTNYVDVTNIASYSTIGISNGCIWITYESNLQVNAGDVITIKIVDLVKHYETDTTWNAEVAFDTSAGKFRSTTLRPGKSLKISYIAPLPSGMFSISPVEVYYNLKYFTNTIFISNTGEGTSDWDLVELTLPLEFRSGFNPSLISGSSATNIAYNVNTGKITFYYSNFAVGHSESINIPVSNNSISNSVVYFNVEVRNFVNQNTVSGNGEFLLSTLPEYFITPNRIDTTTRTNSFVIEVWNTINGSAGIKKLRLHLPEEFKEIVSIDSVKLTNESGSISGDITNLLVDYTKEGKEITKADVKDVINIKLVDDLEIGSVIKYLTIEGDGGYGFVKFKVKEGATNELAFNMPAAYAIATVSPNYIYLGSVTNRIEVSLSNTGSNYNYITYAKIEVPAGMENIRNITSTFGGKISITNKVIYIDYTTDLLKIGEKDNISFDVDNTVNSVSNLIFKVEVANITNNLTYYRAKDYEGRDPLVYFVLPPFVVEANFYDENKIYIIETNSTLIYRVKNLDPYGMELTNLSIYLSTNTNIFRYFNVTSSRGVINITGGTNIVINYSGKPLDYNQYDDLIIELGYQFDSIFRINFDSYATLKKENEVTNVKTIVSSGSESVLVVTNGGWGIVEGSVFPGIHSVNVKMYKEGESSVAINVKGEQLVTSTALSNGYYILKKILPGNYRIEFSKTGVFKTDSTNITVVADRVVKLPPFRMRNAPLSAGANDVQQVSCYDDMQSYVVFPVGSIKEDFSVDILRQPFTKEQVDNMNNNKFIKKPSYDTNMYGYKLDIYDLRDISIDGATLNLDAILYLHYDKDEITARGWKEDDLAIFYWDNISGYSKWIRIGGVVDKDRKFVSARAGYLHGFYAVMGKDGEVAGVIRNVNVRPKVFTPKDKDGYFGSVRLTFEFDRVYDRYEVRIYDLKGNLVKKFERIGGYTQGEVSWDATDSEGYPVKTGVYIYQIIAGNEKYSGTVIIAR